MSTVIYSQRLDSELKSQSERIYKSLGMNLSTAISVFLRKSVSVGGFPFDVRLNSETVNALLEAERIAVDPGVKSYDTVDELFEELDNED